MVKRKSLPCRPLKSRQRRYFVDGLGFFDGKLRRFSNTPILARRPVAGTTAMVFSALSRYSCKLHLTKCRARSRCPVATMKLFRLSSLLAFLGLLLTGLGALRADDAPAVSTDEKQPINVCIVSGEHLQPGEIVTYVHKEEGKPDRVLRFCCRK